MPSGYTFDIFLSYRRSGPGNAREWVHNHFHPLLVACLADQLAWEPKVFLDREVRTGSHWPTTLRNALLRSKLLVAVWSPPYFLSSWCLAEWQSLEAREQHLGSSHPHALVYPVIFSDSENFPVSARNRQARDLRSWSYPHRSFRDTPEYNDLHREVVAIAAELSHMLRMAPEWDAAWPIREPSVPAATAPELPRVE